MLVTSDAAWRTRDKVVGCTTLPVTPQATEGVADGIGCNREGLAFTCHWQYQVFTAECQREIPS